MIVQKEFLQRLKRDFSLNIYEVKIWTALLSRGIATAGELADISGVPRSRCYDVLETLEKKNFIIMKIGKPIKYIAVPPEEIVERVKKHLNRESQLSLRMLDDIRGTDVFKELELLHSSGIEHVDADKISNSLKGRDQVYVLIKSLLHDARKSVTIATTEEGFERKLKLLRAAMGNISKRDVKVKILTTKAGAKAEGIKIKTIAHPMRFVSIDSEQMVFFLTSEETSQSYDTAVWIKSPFTVAAIERLADRN